MVNQLYIDGVWTDGSDERTWSVTIPTTGDWLSDVTVAAAEDVDRAAPRAWRATLVQLEGTSYERDSEIHARPALDGSLRACHAFDSREPRN